jgi:opacity protein-like surface antigen
MKVQLAAAAILLASTSMGSAADMAVKAPYVAPAAVWSWTGFYIGGHVGAGWGTTESTLTAINPGGAIPGGLPSPKTAGAVSSVVARPATTSSPAGLSLVWRATLRGWT